MAGGDRNSGATDRRARRQRCELRLVRQRPRGLGNQYQPVPRGVREMVGEPDRAIPGGSDNAYIDKGTCQVSDARSVSTADLGTYCTANTGVPALIGNSVLNRLGRQPGRERLDRRREHERQHYQRDSPYRIRRRRQCDRQRLCRERWQLLRHNYPIHRRI